MNNQNTPSAPPPPPNIRHSTAVKILKQTSALSYSNLITFIFLSSLLLIFRSNVHSASRRISSLVDKDPSLLSRLDLSADEQTHHDDHLRHRRRRSSLHMFRFGMLEDDLFARDSDFDLSIFRPSSRKPGPNSTYMILSGFTDYGFSNLVVDHGISLPKIVKPGAINFMPKYRENVMSVTVEGEEMKFVESRLNDGNASVDSDFLVKGFGLRRGDATSLFFLVGVLSAAYVFVVSTFIVTYTWVNGIIFLKVVDHLLGNHRSFFRTFRDGSNIGLQRLRGFIVMKWAVRDAIAQMMGIYFFGDIEDQHVFFEVFLKMKLIPFANVVPWVLGHERESAGFTAIWFLSEFVVGFVFSVASWVAMVDWRRSRGEILREGYSMLMPMFYPAFKIVWLETVICGSVGRWLLRRVCGHVCAMIIQSSMEVYFMVAWLVFYFAARHEGDASVGRTFGRRELEVYLEVALADIS